MDSLFTNYRHRSRTYEPPSNVEGKASNNALRIMELEAQLEAMAMKCQAMWELLCHAGQLNDQHLIAKLQEIDLRDGTADGKMTPSVAACPTCKRNTSRRRPHCLYCGEPVPVSEMFATTNRPTPPRDA